MSLLKSMSRDLGRTQRVSINDVRVNRLNEAIYDESDEDMLNGLMDSIRLNGQMENAIAYEDEKNREGIVDGKLYTLLGGNTRYLAIEKLSETGLADGYINISIVEKPSSVSQELQMIVTNNIQRRKSAEERYHEVQIMENAYNRLEQKPEGNKRDWIGAKLGISGRYVDKLIKKFNPQSEEQSKGHQDNENEKMEQLPSLNTNDDVNVEGQTEIFDFIEDEEPNEEKTVTSNANKAPQIKDFLKTLNNGLKAINKAEIISHEIGIADSTSNDLNNIIDQIKEIITMLQGS